MPFDGNPNPTEVQLTLIAARALVKQGWCKNASMKPLKRGPHYCVTGAIRHVIYGVPYVTQAVLPEQVEMLKQALLAFQATIIMSPGGIESWNDARDRKKSEVLAAFDRAINLGGTGYDK